MENQADRIRSFLTDPDAPRTLGYGQPRRYATPSRQTIIHSSSDISTRAYPSPRSSRTGSSGSKSNPSDCFDTPLRRVDSQSTVESLTAPSSAPAGDPPWHVHVANQTYNLHMNAIASHPCEFGFIGCLHRFQASEMPHWLAHTISHFGLAGPPALSICTICDMTFENRIDPYIGFTARMLHIHDHIVNDDTTIYYRPDFGLIDHLKSNGLISPEDYERAMEYTERPVCEYLVKIGFRTDEMQKKYKKDVEERHDLSKEKRQMRKEASKGKARFIKENSRPREVPRSARIGEAPSNVSQKYPRG